MICPDPSTTYDMRGELAQYDYWQAKREERRERDEEYALSLQQPTGEHDGEPWVFGGHEYTLRTQGTWVPDVLGEED
jgi:hypothetical protein